jgi:hypothetical protein
MRTAADLASAFAKARRKSARNANLDLAGTPPPCSDEELSKQSCRQRPACAAQCSHKIGRAIRCKSLQALQQRREGHEGSPDHKRPGPSKTDKQRNREPAEEMVELPTELCARRPIGGAQRGEHDQHHGGHAAKFCHGFDCHSVRSTFC